jgi:hypothetical protein
MTAFDRRITPARPDRAAAFLQGQIEAAHYVQGEPRSVIAASAPVRREPQSDCRLDTEALRGEHVTLYDERDGWAWVQLARDGYCGYLSAETLGPIETSTHRVAALRTLVFPGPDLKQPIIGMLTLGAAVPVLEWVGRYARAPDGFVPAGHLAAIGTAEPDFVSVAERFLGAPYIWGGKTSLGLDCSGLVQVALQAAGRPAPRDSDMQRRDLGTDLPAGTPLRRGDLVFWPGHVGILRDAETLLHANAQAMMVASEPLAEAVARIDAAGSPVTAFKRL